MKPPPDNPEFRKFTAAMRKIMKVSKTEMTRRIEAEKQLRPSTSRASAASAKP